MMTRQVEAARVTAFTPQMFSVRCAGQLQGDWLMFKAFRRGKAESAVEKMMREFLISPRTTILGQTIPGSIFEDPYLMGYLGQVAGFSLFCRPLPLDQSNLKRLTSPQSKTPTNKSRVRDFLAGPAT